MDKVEICHFLSTPAQEVGSGQLLAKGNVTRDHVVSTWQGKNLRQASHVTVPCRGYLVTKTGLLEMLTCKYSG